MDRTPVQSSHIASVGYDAGTRKLHVEFHNGDLHEFSNVPEQYARTFMNDRSIGSAFHKYIKPHFKSVKL